MTDGLVSDLRVLDMSQGIAGPLAGKLLADQGAEVVKIEPPEGDYARRRGPFPHDIPHPEKSLTFAYYNTGKKGITLNIRTPTGATLLKELVRQADILIEDLRPGELASLGLGYEALAQVNPRLILVSVTPFGQYGPYKDFAAEDITLQAISGFLYLSGDADKPPVQVALEQAQIMGGRCAAIATMLAVMERWASGRGQHVDVSIAEAVASQPPMHIVQYAYVGVVTTRGPRTPNPTDGDYLPCKDGYICLTTGGGNPWEKFAQLFQAPELLDPRFATREGRARHGAEIQRLLVERLRERGKYEVFHTAMQDRFVLGVVQTPEEVLACPHLKEREAWQEVSHPFWGTLRYPRNGFRLNGRPAGDIRPAPLLGQHNAEVFCEWVGLPRDILPRLRAEGII
ncbi:MAG: CoA transferase [Dehalococcoidia bacterium]|nr:CoA transferase [Dehalococcoidia bacterium]MDW8119559.1 CoA transferase [Chloroflexota bacterium]